MFIVLSKLFDSVQTYYQPLLQKASKSFITLMMLTKGVNGLEAFQEVQDLLLSLLKKQPCGQMEGKLDLYVFQFRINSLVAYSIGCLQIFKNIFKQNGDRPNESI